MAAFLNIIPLWIWFAWLLVAFMSGNFASYRGRQRPPLPPQRRRILRILTLVLLVVALLMVGPITALPATVLAAAGGVLNGRTAPSEPPKPSP